MIPSFLQFRTILIWTTDRPFWSRPVWMRAGWKVWILTGFLSSSKSLARSSPVTSPGHGPPSLQFSLLNQSSLDPGQALTRILISGYLSGLLRPPPVPGGHPGGHPGPPPLAPPPPSPGPRPPIIGGLPGYSAPGECLSVWRGGKLEKYNCVFSHRAPETRGLSCVKIELFVLVTLYRLTK